MKNLKKKKLVLSLILVLTVAIVSLSSALITSAATVTIGADGTANFTNAQFYVLGSSNVTTYTTSAGTTVSGAIYPNDLCTVLSATGTYWKVRYPTSSGSKTAYCNKANILSNTSYCKRISITANETVYRKSDMSTSFGTTYTTDTIYMLSPISNGKAQIIYNISGGFKIGWIYATEQSVQPVSVADMRSRAEAIVNYQWTPSKDISTWNGNTYTYPDGTETTVFKAGTTVIGMPYTLFSSELGFDSLLSLNQYKNVVFQNYSTSKYCNSVGAQRSGPAYGSCCATFVSEVWSGYFMNGSNPRYDSVLGIQNDSQYVKLYDEKANSSNIKPGDAMITSGHIIWIGDVTSTDFVIYEQAAGYAAAIKHNIKRTSVDSNGYLSYNDSTYKTVARPYLLW